MSTSSDSPGAYPTDDDTEMEYSTPQDSNGMNGHVQDNGDSSPAPPPHKAPSAPPKPDLDPEACKAMGNKYFKAKDYSKAVEEYTKGKEIIRPPTACVPFAQVQTQLISGACFSS
jgi:hypothetical protein